MNNIDLSQEEIGTVFYTRNYSEAKLIGHIGLNFHRFEVDTVNTFDTEIRTYSRRGNVVQPDMRKSHPLDLIEKQ